MTEVSSISLQQFKFSASPEWGIECDLTDRGYFSKNAGAFEYEVKKIINYVSENPLREEFRWYMEVASMQFTVAIYPSEKHILIASKNLSREMVQVSLLDKERTLEEANFINFIKRVASIPIENSPTVIEFISSVEKLPLFNEGKFESVHNRSNQISETLVKKVKSYKQSYFEKFSDYGLGLTANYMLIRIHLLKFLAILPNLDHDHEGEEVKRIFLESLRRLVIDSDKSKLKELTGQKKALPAYITYSLICLQTLSKLLPAKYLAKSLRFSVGVMARRFIAGTDILDAEKSLKELLSSGRGATIDQLGELVVSNTEADEYTAKVVSIIQGLSLQIPKGTKNSAGINQAHVSIKVSALCNDFKPHDFAYSYKNIAPRLKLILMSGMSHDVFINIDAEHYHYRDQVFDIYSKVLLDNSEFFEWNQTGIVVQAYLRDGINHLRDVIGLAKKRNLIMPIRLVKGAYWDAETIEAEAHNFVPPQFLNKDETDIHFRQLIFETLQAGEYLQLAVASHNLQDHCFSEALREKQFSSAPIIEHQCLHMTYEGLSVGLAKMGWATRNYIPVGHLLVGMAYLVRRIMENSSQVGVLTIMRSHKNALERKTPTQKLKHLKKRGGIFYDDSISKMSGDFKNIYPLRSYRKNHLTLALESLNRDLKMLEEGKRFYESGSNEVVCSSNPKLILGYYNNTTEADIDVKIEKLFENYKSSQYNPEVRSFQMLKLAELMLQQREDLTSLIMLEAGKTLDEAIGDVDEAIDFINFYVREQAKLRLTQKISPKGVVGVIAPWNFPLAIACGMSVAPYIAGNNIILKPSEHTSLIGRKFSELLLAVGVKEETFAVVFGAAEAGKAIVEHELLAGVVFTGSKNVGTQIFEKISGQPLHSAYGVRDVKFAITEMGGKNAIIVTNNSELDETVSGVIYSAFAHSGQKCSAASRVIIDERLKEAFLVRFREAVNDVKVGPAYDLATVINPLITKNDKERVKALAIKAQEEMKDYDLEVIVDRTNESHDSFCVGPAVFSIDSDIPRTGTLAQLEVFGPMLHIISYKTLDDAISIFNETEYALTGGIYCQSQDDIDYILPQLEAGNIYINRPNTGARVGIEPFGGFKLSGTGPKAGSRQYLSQFSRFGEIFEEEIILEDTSVESDFEIAVNSRLNQTQRVSKVEETYRILLDQYNSYVDILNDRIKNEFSLRANEILAYFKELEYAQYENRYIPGQLSFDKKDFRRGVCLFVESQPIINPHSICVVMINLLAGNGVNIICTNDKVFSQWERLHALFFNNGISSYNFKIDRLGPIALAKVLSEQSYHTVTFSSFDVCARYRDSFISNNQNSWIIKSYFLELNRDLEDLIDRYIQRLSLIHI